MIAASVVIALGGLLARRGLSRDVVPELADPQIAVVADWPGHGSPEVASRVTAVVSAAMEGIPGVTAVRGSSMSDLAYVDVLFASAARLVGGRAAILERVESQRSRLPPGVRIQVGPVASSIGWIYQYALVDPTNGQPPRALRRLQDEVLRPALAAIPGVAEVASVGGATQEILVEALADPLRERGLAFADLATTMRAWLAAGPKREMVELAGLRVVAPASATGTPGPERPPAMVRDVARVRVADAMPEGLADLGGIFTATGGIVIATRAADLAAVIGHVQAILARERARLPPGVELVTIYNRLELADRIDRTLLLALGEEVVAVVLVVLLFLMSGRSALVPLATLPVVLLLTFAAMWLAGVPATIMSLGGIGIALGIAVDADVVALEACHRWREPLGPAAPEAERRAALVAAAASFAPAILTSLLITAITFLPVLAFSGETGRLLGPLALTKTLVVLAAGVVALSLAPALRDRLLRGPVIPELQNPLTRRLVTIYEPFVRFALARPGLTLTTAALAVVSCVPILVGGRLGGEFLPRVDEGDLLFMPTTLPGPMPHEMMGELRRQDRAIAAFGEVASVFGKVGRADTATDPAPLSMAETTVRLRPRDEWPKLERQRWFSGWAPAPVRRVLGWFWPEKTPRTTAELIAALDRAASLPGWTSAWTAPARARADMMSTGVRTPVAIRIVAPTPARLEALGTALRALVLRLPGTRNAVVESQGGDGRFEYEPDAVALARLGVEGARARDAADLILAGGWLGEAREQGRRLPLRLIPEENVRGPADQLREATVRSGPTGAGAPVALALVGRPRWTIQSAAVRSEGGELCSYVLVDLEEGTDLLGYVSRARRESETAPDGALALAPGERIEWTGQYQLLDAGRRRLRWIIPIVALSMLALLFLQFRSLAEALIVLASVPFALVGSVWTLFLLGYPLSAPTSIGLLSVIGLAMQTGVVMVVYIDEAFYRRVRERRLRTRDDIVAAHAEGTVKRLRPKLMTVTTMLAGLLPLLWAEGAAGEIMRLVAVPMIGGLVSSTFLTLEVLPVLYTIWRHRQLKRAERRGVSIEDVVGSIPPWVR